MTTLAQRRLTRPFSGPSEPSAGTESLQDFTWEGGHIGACRTPDGH